jgi:hypothetical protein
MVGPDRYPLLASSELAEEHNRISELLEELGNAQGMAKVLGSKTFTQILSADAQAQARFYLALLERTFAYDAKLMDHEENRYYYYFSSGPAAITLARLFGKALEAEAVVRSTLEWFSCYRFNYYATIIVRRALAWLAERYTQSTLPQDFREQLITLRGQCDEVDNYLNAEMHLLSQGQLTLTDLHIADSAAAQCSIHPARFSPGAEHYTRHALHLPYDQPVTPGPLETQIDGLLGRGPWLMLVPCEQWARAALARLNELLQVQRDSWSELLWHCHDATPTRPSAKWLKEGRKLVQAVGETQVAERLLDWFPLVDRGRSHPTLGVRWENVDEQQRMHSINATVLRGLLWLCPAVTTASPAVIRAIGEVAISAYRKIRGLGPRAVKVGNAAVYALSQIDNPAAVGQLALLKVKVKFGAAHKEIEKAFTAAAQRSGLPRDEIEETSVPAYGLSKVGVCEEVMGEFTARLTVTGTTSTELVWVKSDGKIQRSVPAPVKEAHKEDLKELQAATKDIQRMLPAQRERIDGLFLQQKTWPFASWKERYLDHPLLGTLARRILWDFTSGGRTITAIWFNERLVDVDLQPVALDEARTTVQLWHPIGKPAEDIVAWRSWLDAQQIQQPFKQAHREIYLLTDAERNTRVYSNRYAAHVLKQHQFSALCALRGWKNQLRLMVDAEYAPPTLHLPKWGLRAEFWVEGIGNNYGADTNESGVYLHLSTDQVRFYKTGAEQRTAHAGGGGYRAYRQDDADPVPLAEIPELVFSEVMRDVDMFVGVASVGNDPAWSDGGPEGRYRDYWQTYSFGNLNGSAKTRKEVLERLVPRLKIADRCSFSEKFLMVKGDLRTYKIHLGSGNILMSPNDKYLCIVPNQTGAAGEAIQLPFEGDRTLSVILSKAFLLAADTKIKDQTILSQIR